MPKIFRSAIILSLLLCCGASEFPVFEMKEYEEAIEQEDYFEEIEAEEFDIPTVSERFYGEEELQRLPILELTIDEVTPYPEKGISQEVVQQFINQELERQQGIELDEYGFTARDMQGVGRFLRRLLDRGGRPDRQDMTDLMRLVQKQELERSWITIEQLDVIAQVVTDFYRQKGFILATAFIPEQEVSDGKVHLKMLEGRLGQVTVSNNQIYSKNTIKAAFFNDLGDVVTDEGIEGTLRRINDLPGVRVRGSFSPGQEIGETSLNLSVLDETSWSSTFLLDNHGSPITGEERAYISTEWLNMANRGQRLTLGVLQSKGPDSSTFGLIEYELPFTQDQRGKFKANTSSNEFSVPNLSPSDKDIVGKTISSVISGSYQHIRGRTSNIKSEVSYKFKDVLLEVPGLPLEGTDQKIEVVSLATDFSRLWDEKQLLVTGRAGIEQGHFLQGERENQAIDFTKVLVNANILKRFTLNNVLTKKETAFNLLVKLNAQYSEEFLPPVEQFSLGGPNGVRAFSVSDVSMDSGVYLGVELYFDLPFDPFEKLNLPFQVVKPFIFFDYAYGVQRYAGGSLTGDMDAQIKAYGLGMRLSLTEKLGANLIFARPKSTRYEGNFLEAEGKDRIFIDIVYSLK